MISNKELDKRTILCYCVLCILALSPEGSCEESNPILAWSSLFRSCRKESHPVPARLPRASMGQVFLLTPPKSFHLEPLLSRQYFACISPLAATLTKNRGYLLPAKIL